MELSPGVFDVVKQLESQKAKIAAMRESLHSLMRSDDKDNAVMASAILHLADQVNVNTDAITAIHHLLKNRAQ